MHEYRNELAKIKELLRKNPKGLTISEISEGIKINRNSVAKYMDVLRISGRVEKRDFGPAKVYTLSQRVPTANMMNYSSDYIIILDYAMRISRINTALKGFFNLKSKETYGKKIYEVNHPFFEGQELITKAYECMRNKKQVRFNTSLDWVGSNFYFLVKIVPTTFSDGGEGLTIIIENITEETKASLLTKASEEKYRTIFETSGTAMVIIEENTIISLINSQFEIMTGLKKEEVEGKKSWKEFIPSKYIEIMSSYHNLRRKNAGDIPTRYESEIMNHLGEIKQVLLNVNIIPKTKQSVASIIDISDLRKTEKSLKEAYAYQKAILESVPESFILVDHKGIVRNFNSIAEKNAKSFFKFELGLGLNLFDLLRKEHSKGFKKSFTNAIKGKESSIDIKFKDIVLKRKFYPAYDNESIIGVCIVTKYESA
jgi:PAS domain S-box-containing protein